MSQAGSAQTMPLQNVMNAAMRTALKLPVVSGLIGRRLLTLYVTGRKSGKRYEIPVAYTPHDGALLVGSPFAWGKNLRTGEPIEVQLRGQRRTADVTVVSDEAGVTELYGVIAKDNGNFAKFNGITVRDGVADPEDLRRAFEGGARVFVLTPR
ncbi:nitroreductase/quinone reductase family protein [Tsukamurella sp. 8F]|uniref:nitroreductase/quinone reductase family protein n=1 Tax=unclassified Tsukamurella TaxID=2633480 RepID=UPI0023BA2B4B|nr:MULTISPECIES: nitroreductase/quinone reductase family protein [unclassified Tsukamurella]MDF0531803.1 nitroreductase/quinone reductase family protein [Tsukamurella sp. 8J]MDF0589045.1 nitroreductase/quinone reductase family protein [Tsukamurella sp. 8F]